VSANAFITLTPDSAPEVVFKRKLEAGELSYQQCDVCASNFFPPRVLCPVCGSPKVLWRISSGCGTVYTATTLYARGEEPYNVSLIDVDEGFRMMSSVINLPPDDVTIGLRVTLAISTDGAEAIPYFAPEST